MKFLSNIRILGALKDRYEPEAVHMLADTYWHAILVVSTLIVFGVVSYNIWEFIDIDHSISVQTSDTTLTEEKLPFESAKLQMVVDGFKQRQITYELYAAQASAATSTSHKGAAEPDPTR